MLPVAAAEPVPPFPLIAAIHLRFLVLPFFVKGRL